MLNAHQKSTLCPWEKFIFGAVALKRCFLLRVKTYVERASKIDAAPWEKFIFGAVALKRYFLLPAKTYVERASKIDALPPGKNLFLELSRSKDIFCSG